MVFPTRSASRDSANATHTSTPYTLQLKKSSGPASLHTRLGHRPRLKIKKTQSDVVCALVGDVPRSLMSDVPGIFAILAAISIYENSYRMTEAASL